MGLADHHHEPGAVRRGDAGTGSRSGGVDEEMGGQVARYSLMVRRTSVEWSGVCELLLDVGLGLVEDAVDFCFVLVAAEVDVHGDGGAGGCG
jgi:hypothetical protein